MAGNRGGLVRFDGNSLRFSTRIRRQRCREPMCAACWSEEDGALWIGTSEGLARWKDVVTPSLQRKGCREMDSWAD